jgi:hypothetical protein
MTYRVFKRRWWKDATGPGWPNDLEPDPTARRTYIATVNTEAEARQLRHYHNADINPGRYGLKYEYEEV